MTEMTPAVLALKAELQRAIRLHHARGQGRRRVLRTGAVGVLAALAILGSSFCAGAALGVIQLGGHETARQIVRLPHPTGAFAVACPTHCQDLTSNYLYRLSGGTVLHDYFGGVNCGPPHSPEQAHPIYVGSPRALSPKELEAVGKTLDGARGARFPQETGVLVQICRASGGRLVPRGEHSSRLLPVGFAHGHRLRAP
jgi:hypothetical protein